MKLMDNCELSTIIFNDRDNRDPNRAQKRSHKEEQKEIPTHNPEPRYPHREKKRPEEERGSCLVCSQERHLDFSMRAWLGSLPCFPAGPNHAAPGQRCHESATDWSSVPLPLCSPLCQTTQPPSPPCQAGLALHPGNTLQRHHGKLEQYGPASGQELIPEGSGPNTPHQFSWMSFPTCLTLWITPGSQKWKT